MCLSRVFFADWFSSCRGELGWMSCGHLWPVAAKDSTRASEGVMQDYDVYESKMLEVEKVKINQVVIFWVPHLFFDMKRLMPHQHSLETGGGGLQAAAGPACSPPGPRSQRARPGICNTRCPHFAMHFVAKLWLGEDYSSDSPISDLLSPPARYRGSTWAEKSDVKIDLNWRTDRTRKVSPPLKSKTRIMSLRVPTLYTTVFPVSYFVCRIY